ncbi:MAG: hypothetical protein AAFU67_02655 [Bacteroidota bacterium]
MFKRENIILFFLIQLLSCNSAGQYVEIIKIKLYFQYDSSTAINLFYEHKVRERNDTCLIIDGNVLEMVNNKITQSLSFEEEHRLYGADVVCDIYWDTGSIDTILINPFVITMKGEYYKHDKELVDLLYAACERTNPISYDLIGN